MHEFKVTPGEFPYPLVDGPEESRYLTWVRNHSNYLAERGFLDYLRIVAVLVRGILINILVLLPPLLLVALVLSVYATLVYDWATVDEGLETTGKPFLLTAWVALLTLVWYLLYPVVITLFKAATHKQSAATGKESSVKLRDRVERSFSGALLVLAGVALLESLPLLVHGFHETRGQPGFGMREMLATMAGSSIVALIGAGHLISLLGKVWRSLAILVIALLGLLLPLLVVFYVTEFLVFGDVQIGLVWWHLELVPVLLALGIVAALVLSLVKGTLQRPGWLLAWLLGVLACMVAVFVLKEEMIEHKWLLVLTVAVEIWLFARLAIDVNLTSVHGMYRDRLAAAFLVGEDRGGDVDIEEDIDLQQICQYDNGSTAPYHLVNVALNLQGSSDISIRERNSDFFIFSKKFIGSQRTGYTRSATLESVFPQMDLATAMAISAAAASPNMGTSTKAPIVALMTLFNVRLGYWVPNPGQLENDRSDDESKRNRKEGPLGYMFSEVFQEELQEIGKRWGQTYARDGERQRAASDAPTPAHGLVGIGFSGGGIRSATINLGLTQALHRRGVFDHIDYMSTVSGGGYLGSSISTLMRKKGAGDDPVSEIGTVGDRFSWRVRPSAFIREMRCLLDEEHRWVNLSDGGHIENMAAIELLRRRCRYILIGDGEADPEMKFKGLATLVRYARIDLGIHIDINLNALRLGAGGLSERHFAVGRIRYPNEDEPGYLLYLKSSLIGSEDEVVKEYRAKNPLFPHESTADQFFDEGQFEAYRAMGQHIGESALVGAEAEKLSFKDFQAWFETLAQETPNSPWRSDSP